MTPFDAEVLLKDGARLRALAADLVRGTMGVGGDVDDLVQETWLRALQTPRRVGFSPRAWLAGLVRNVARERRRAETRRATHEHAATPTPAPADDPAEVAARFDLLRRLLSFIDAMAEPQRTTLIRRYVDGLEPMEIARLDGIPDATVRSRIKRGLDELRVRLDAERGGDRAAWMAALLPWSRPSAVAATAVVFEGLALKWIALAAAGALALAGVAVVAARAKSGHDDSSQAAARPRAAESGAPTSPRALAAEGAIRIADSAGAPAGSVAADPSADGTRTKTGWRIEGRLLGLDPSTPWTGTIRVVPIANGIVEFVDGPQGVEAPLVEGRFAADLVPPAAEPGSSAPWLAWQVTATDPAYVDVRKLVDVLGDHGVPRAPCTLHVDLTTRRSARLRGRVVDEAGAPVPSMDVGWRDSAEDESWLEGQHTQTDATGRYSIEVPRIGPTYVSTWIEAEKPCDLLAAIVRVDLHSGADVEAPDLVMRRGVTIHGLVVDGEGDPEPGAIVSAGPVWTTEELADPTAESVSGRTATADRAGEFELRGLRRGRTTLAIKGRAGLRAHPSVQNSLVERATVVDAPADGVELEDDLCRVELHLRFRGAVAKRTLFSIDGANPARTSCCTLGSQTDDTGTYTFLAVPGFHFGIRCDLPGVEPTAKLFDVGVTDRRRIVDLDFEARHPRASLALALRDPAGGIVGRTWVRLEPLSDPALGAYEKRPELADGAFLVEDVDPGRYRALVRAGGGHFGSGGFFEEETFDVDLLTPTRVEKTVALRPTGRLRVSAFDSDGKPVRANVTVVDELGRRSGVGLAFEEAGSAMFSPVGTLSNPSFVVPPPPPGRYRVDFTADGFFPQSVDAQVVRGETTDVAVTLLRR
ncbi:MAG TPA: sigma-70 family RNA polymerase sigma factor [Planctomycetota bacterium]|nr:sigma-70 family RNA polymerase sigma factor [Planctomycetota bacterium]